MTHPNPLGTLTSGKVSPRGRAAFSGIDAEILLGGEAAPMTVMAMTVAPDMGAPAHIAHEEDKLFHITGGRLLFLVGAERIDAAEGDCLFIARGVVHSFSALDGRPARMTLSSTPERHDRFFQAPGDLSLPHRPEEVQAVCARFGQSIVGPIVTADFVAKNVQGGKGDQSGDEG